MSGAIWARTIFGVSRSCAECHQTPSIFRTAADTEPRCRPDGDLTVAHYLTPMALAVSSFRCVGCQGGRSRVSRAGCTDSFYLIYGDWRNSLMHLSNFGAIS